MINLFSCFVIYDFIIHFLIELSRSMPVWAEGAENKQRGSRVITGVLGRK